MSNILTASPTRRAFLGGAAATTLTAAAYARVPGANERVGLGVIGCGGRGRSVLGRFVELGTAVPVLCDPDVSQIEKAQKLLKEPAAFEKDFRKVLDRKDVDAVLIATPDHWHALPAVLACHAGKDVYVEKPTAYTVAESRAMVTAAAKAGRVMQVGTQQRSGTHFQKAVESVRNGDLGTVSHVRFWNVWNNTLKDGGGRAGGIGNPADGPAPAGVDYDLWLGPAPVRPFNPNRFHWNYAYFWDYSGGMMSGWGVHHMDIIHWAMGADAPKTVSAVGGKYVLTDNRETPDTMDAFFEYPGFTVQGSMYHANGRLIEGKEYGVAFYGSKATLVIDRAGYEVSPEGQPEAARTRVPGVQGDGPHQQNFLDCLKSRAKPVAPVEVTHRSTIPVLLANIALHTERKLTWDAVKERCLDDAAADALLTREYRKPWTFPA